MANRREGEMHDAKGKINLNNVTMVTFRETIMFRCMKRHGEVRNIMKSKERTKCEKFTPIITVRLYHENHDTSISKINNFLKANKSIMKIKLSFEWVKPYIASNVINKNRKTMKSITRGNRGSSNIRENQIQRSMQNKCGIRK